MKIPLIKPDLPELSEIEEQLSEVLANGRITNFGKYVTQFEKETGEYLNTQALAVSSGTAGLVFTLAGLGLQPGERVILPSFTFVATAQAVRLAGGVPVFAEAGEDLNLCPEDLAFLLEQHQDIAAVIAVHMYGLPAKVRQIQEIVEAASVRRGRKIALIFDAAHAFGAAIDGVRVGGFGDAEVFSLSVTKVLVSVEGGLVLSRNANLIKKIRAMRNYGIESNYNAHFLGMNGKMSELHAIVGLANLRKIDGILQTRQERASYFRKRIQRHTHFGLAAWPDNVLHTFKDFSIVVPAGENGSRDEVMRLLAEQGVETRAYFYPPVHEQVFFRQYADRPLPRTERLARQVVTLPFFTAITDAEIDYMVQALVRVESGVLTPAA